MTAVYILYGYCAVGFVFALWFSFFKLRKIDEAAKGSTVWFRLIIMPASILLWPIVCKKLFEKGRSKVSDKEIDHQF